MDRFTLEKNRWYAAEIIGNEFGADIKSYSPIRVEDISPKGARTFKLCFYHASYPEGVRQKDYELQTLERNQHFILAKSVSHEPSRWLLIHNITPNWLNRHFSTEIDQTIDIESWLERNV